MIERPLCRDVVIVQRLCSRSSDKGAGIVSNRFPLVVTPDSCHGTRGDFHSAGFPGCRTVQISPVYTVAVYYRGQHCASLRTSQWPRLTALATVARMSYQSFALQKDVPTLQMQALWSRRARAHGERVTHATTGPDVGLFSTMPVVSGSCCCLANREPSLGSIQYTVNELFVVFTSTAMGPDERL